MMPSEPKLPRSDGSISANVDANQRRETLKRDRTLCAYCPAPATTSDHVPPHGIFGDLLKTDHSVQLVTVPSCAACNHPESRDDAYFRDAMFVAAG
jgi:hypothetical protein